MKKPVRNTFKLEQKKLLGFRIQTTEQASVAKQPTAVAAKIGGKAGAKLGTKVGAKGG